jgi:EamA domain-containing membrane protein RarD
LNSEQESINNRLGLIFVSIAVFFWGILPIALKLSGGFITPVTLTWFRFVMALVVTLLIQWRLGALRHFVGLSVSAWVKLVLAGVLLMCNYVSFVYSLGYLAPGTAQLNFQTAPFFLAFGGVLFFKERFNAFATELFCHVSLRYADVFPSTARFEPSQRSSGTGWDYDCAVFGNVVDQLCLITKVGEPAFITE